MCREFLVDAAAGELFKIEDLFERRWNGNRLELSGAAHLDSLGAGFARYLPEASAVADADGFFRFDAEIAVSEDLAPEVASLSFASLPEFCENL